MNSSRASLARDLRPLSRMGMYLYTCERCREDFVGAPYRVVSENDGVLLLDMIVCHVCYLEASQLGLDTQEVEVGQILLH